VDNVCELGVQLIIHASLAEEHDSAVKLVNVLRLLRLSVFGDIVVLHDVEVLFALAFDVR
jgi:hypothetical protein